MSVMRLAALAAASLSLVLGTAACGDDARVPDEVRESARNSTAPPGPPPPTRVVNLVAVDRNGRPANDFSVIADPAGILDCSAGTPSRSSVTPGIHQCGAPGARADVCWPGPQPTRLLCADDPWTRTLRAFDTTAPLQPVGMQRGPLPWALELADGTRCRAGMPPVWPHRPFSRADGLTASYTCERTDEMVLQDPGTLSSIDISTPTWTVRLGLADRGSPPFPPPRVVEVRTAYYAALDQPRS